MFTDDVFVYLGSIFSTGQSNVFDKLHILIHADDANLIATTKELMIRKCTSMLEYCKLNSIILQASKCFFIVLNGSVETKNRFRLELRILSQIKITYRSWDLIFLGV